jgi:hypothetical protein
LENFIRLKENKELQEKLESIIKDLRMGIPPATKSVAKMWLLPQSWAIPLNT